MINWSIQLFFFSSPKKTPPTKSFRSPSPASASLPASAWSVFDSLIHWFINKACFVQKKRREGYSVRMFTQPMCLHCIIRNDQASDPYNMKIFFKTLLGHSFHQCFPPLKTTLPTFPACWPLAHAHNEGPVCGNMVRQRPWVYSMPSCSCCLSRFYHIL